MVEAGNDHFIIYGVAGVTKVGIFRNSNGGKFFLNRKLTVNKNNGKFRTRVYQYKQHPHVLPRARAGDGEHQPAHRPGRVHRHRPREEGLAARRASCQPDPHTNSAAQARTWRRRRTLQRRPV